MGSRPLSRRPAPAENARVLSQQHVRGLLCLLWLTVCACNGNQVQDNRTTVDHGAKTGATSPDRAPNLAAKKAAKPAKKKIKRRMSEAEERAKIDALLGAKPRKLYDPSKTDPGPTARARQPIVVRGKAENAKLGAVVVSKRGTYYVAGLSEWPPEFAGRFVDVKGHPRTRKMAPDPVVGPNGEVSAGAVGRQKVLERAKWWIVTPF